MTSLDELERDLGPDLRHALASVIPDLEQPPAASTVEVDSPDDAAVVELSRPQPRSGRRSMRWTVTAAAGLVAVVAGIWWIGADRRDTATSVDNAPTVAPPRTDPAGGGAEPVDSGPIADDVATSMVSSVDGLDPLEAARQISVLAVIGPTPDERADLATAGAILEHECVRSEGGSLPALTAADHRALKDAAINELRSITDMVTGGGLAFVRTNGYGARQASGPATMEVTEGSREEGLLIGVCGGADNPLRPGPVERELVQQTEFGAEWGYQRFRPDHYPTYAEHYLTYQDCMSAAGMPTTDLDSTEPDPWITFSDNASPSQQELDYATADVDCRKQADIASVYVDTISPLVAEFVAESTDALAAVQAERATTLEIARAVLIEHDIEPFTQPDAAEEQHLRQSVNARHHPPANHSNAHRRPAERRSTAL